jgi:hypothetical protein
LCSAFIGKAEMPYRNISGGKSGSELSELSFGHLLQDLLNRGIRPPGDRHQGSVWRQLAFAESVGLTARTVRGWLSNAHLPDEIESIERTLFGLDQKDYQEIRLQLRRAYAQTRSQEKSHDDKHVVGDKSVAASFDHRTTILENLGVFHSPVDSGDVLFSGKLREFVEETEKFVVEDQISESGGWPVSWTKVFRYNTGSNPTAQDRREGGILSTYMAIRGLAATNPTLTMAQEPFKSAFLYLDLRQEKADGGIGRFLLSKSGTERRPSMRHTAFGVLALAMLDAPMDQIRRGLDYLLNLTPELLKSDSTPSIAMAVSVLALESASYSNWGVARVPEELRRKTARILKRHQETIMQLLEAECKAPASEFVPLWTPYGGWKPMVYMSGLITIDLLSLCKKPPWNLIGRALEHLSENRVDAALPYNPSLREPDIGVSSYFAMLCFRPSVRMYLLQAGYVHVLDAARECLEFCVHNFRDKGFRKHIFGDTISNALLLRPENISAAEIGR